MVVYATSNSDEHLWTAQAAIHETCPKVDIKSYFSGILIVQNAAPNHTKNVQYRRKRRKTKAFPVCSGAYLQDRTAKWA